MTDVTSQTQVQNTVAESKPSDKELNFRNLEARYEKQLQQERSARLEAERVAKEALDRRSNQSDDDDENDPDPYVDKKNLKKKLSKFGEETKQSTQAQVKEAVQQALKQERQENWLKTNSDFHDVMDKYAETFANHSPELANLILQMPQGFERQQLVYNNIKALGIDKPKQSASSIQEKIDANKRSPYYQPSGIGTSPYASVSDFSTQGQKQAYDKLQELKSRLRL